MARIGRERLFAGGLFVLAAVLYLPALGNGFHYDDFHSIVNNPHVRSVERIGDFFVDSSLFSQNPESAMYRPVLLTSYALNYLIGGPEASWHHAGNVVLHGFNVALLYGLLLALRMPLAQAVVAGLMFAVTPLNSEAVNYVSSRSELMMATFLLASCLCYVHSIKAGSHQHGWFAISVASATLAILTKSVAVITVPLWILCDWLATGSWHSAWSERRTHHLVMLGIIAVYLAYSRSLIGKAMLSPVRDLDVQLWTQAKAWVYYLIMLPFPVHLSVERQFSVSRSLVDGPVLVAGLMLMSLAVVLLLGNRSIQSPATWARFGAAWAAISLLPSAIVPLIVLVNEHRCYLASAGAAIVVAGCVGPMHSRRVVAVAIVSVWVTVAVSLTVARGDVWRSEVTLWRDATVKGPLMVKPHLRLADALERSGAADEAEQSYRRAIELRPAHVSSRNNLGHLLMRQGRSVEAEEQFRVLLSHSPDSIPARLNLGSLLLRQGRWRPAKDEYEAVVRYGDTDGVAHGRLGYIALQREADPEGALDYYKRALALAGSGDRGRLFVGKGAAHRALGQFPEAERCYRQALVAAETSVDVWFNLGNVLRDLRRPSDAIEAFRKVVEIEPNGSLAARANEHIARLENQ
jgi:tetratricopeptide (TPR) repeat protein